jgi:hypothetical protein
MNIVCINKKTYLWDTTKKIGIQLQVVSREFFFNNMGGGGTRAPHPNSTPEEMSRKKLSQIVTKYYRHFCNAISCGV